MKQEQQTYLINFRARKAIHFTRALVLLFAFLNLQAGAQGTWTKVTTKAPDKNGGGMLILSDGSVMAKTFAGSNDGYGKTYDRLAPDVHGSYINGTWTKLANMKDSRLYYSSQVLKDGRVYVAGGEYGSGNSKGETYDPLTNVWTAAPNPNKTISDANSEILPDGRVLQALVTGNLDQTDFYDPVANTYSAGPTCLGKHNECVWVKLPDNSILMVDRNTTSSERYIPSLSQWVADGTVPVSLYDPYGLETGAALLLPDGRAFFIGSTGHCAYYTPSGNNNAGTWAAGPDIPGGHGQPDGPAAMMVNGKILAAVSPAATSGNHFPTPTSFWEFDYIANSWTQIGAPGGGMTKNIPCYVTGLVDLPDGTVLCTFQDSTQYYVYTPGGAPLAAGKPTIGTITQTNCSNSFSITGTLFNGISEGAAYGDDWQMASNYPIVRFTAGSKVYYGRTFNWNRTGVMTGSLPDTTQMTLPVGMPASIYSMVVIANGIASDPVQVSPILTATVTPLGNLDICQLGSVGLQANSGVNYTYQWKKGAQAISGATNQTYTATTAGNYKVVVTNAFGCSKTSGATTVTKSCKLVDQSIASAPSFNLYPNPNSGNFMIDLAVGDESVNASATVQIMNMLGEQLLEEVIPVVNGRMQQEVSLENRNAGMYLVKVMMNDQAFVKQVMISK